MTYRDLKNWINSLQPEELDLDVTIYLSERDEYIPAIDVDRSVESDVMDDDHPVLVA